MTAASVWSEAPFLETWASQRVTRLRAPFPGRGCYQGAHHSSPVVQVARVLHDENAVLRRAVTALERKQDQSAMDTWLQQHGDRLAQVLVVGPDQARARPGKDLDTHRLIRAGVVLPPVLLSIAMTTLDCISGLSCPFRLVVERPPSATVPSTLSTWSLLSLRGDCTC
jgi:hypothetical protein